jgi:hypothetical protein
MQMLPMQLQFCAETSARTEQMFQNTAIAVNASAQQKHQLEQLQFQ